MVCDKMECVRFGVACGMMECVGFGVVCGVMGVCKILCGLWHHGIV